MKRLTILIVHPGGLGDVLLALPAIQTLRASFPQHEIGLIAGHAVGSLLRRCQVVDRLFPIESRTLGHLHAGPEAVTPEEGEWLSRCGLAVCWMADEEKRTTASLQQLGVRQVIMQSLKAQMTVAIHQSERILATIRDYVTVETDDASLQLPQHLREAGGQILKKEVGGSTRPIILLHVGAGSRHKCCRPELLAQVADRLRREGIRPVLLKGPADETVTHEVVRACRRAPVVLGNLDLESLAGVLASATCVIGHDSGVSHLSAALLVPTIVLFGPTDSKRWAPRGQHVTIVTGTPCSCDAWEVVQRCHRKPCLEIPADGIMAACSQVLNRQVSAEDDRITRLV